MQPKYAGLPGRTRSLAAVPSIYVENLDELLAVQDEIEDDETIDDLVKEFQLLEKKYNFKTNGSIRNKRK